ncbi:MAG: hypothetical protein AAGA35_04005 [Patescibacteria group bacterium]
MTRETVVFIAGILVIIIPQLGIPEDWKWYSLVGIGIILILLGYSLRRSAYLRRIDRGNGERGDDSFVESTQNLFEQES